MIFEKIGEGSTIEEALENAKVLLAAPDDVQLQQDILQFPKKKLFGLKTEPAKVKVWYEVADPKPKPQAPAPAKNTPVPAKVTAAAKEAAPQKKNEAATKKSQPAEKKNEGKTEKAPVAVNAPLETPAVKKVPVAVDDNDEAVAYLKTIIKGVGIENCEVSLEVVEETNEYLYTIDCGKADGALIGRRGETLDAIQYLLRLAVNKGVDDDKHRKISVNIGNYREKRNESLRQLAAKHANQVLKYGRNAALEPMNPYERRIIHTAIQGIEGVTSHSVGSDSNRRVIISLAEGVQPTNPGRGYNNHGGYNKGGKGGYNNRGGYNKGRGGHQKREPYKPAVTREPRKDTAGSLYGKIEVPANKED